MGDAEAGRVVVDIDFKVNEAGLAKAKSEAQNLGSKPINIGSKISMPTQDLRSIEREYETFGKGLSGKIASGMDFDKVGSKMEQELTRSMRGMQNTILGNAGVMGRTLMAGGVVGIGAALAIGGGAMAAQAAEAWQQQLKGVAGALGKAQNSPEMQALSKQLQESRMTTGLGAGEIANAAKAGAKGGITDPTELAKSAESAALWAKKWGGSSDEVMKQFTTLGRGVKDEGEGWNQFIDKNGDAIDALAKKYDTSGTAIMDSMTKAAPAIAKLKPSEADMPKWEALFAAAQSLDPTKSAMKIGSEVNAAIQALSATKNQTDFAKLLGYDKATFAQKLKTDTVGTISEVSKALAASPQQADYLAKLGGGKDLFATTGTKEGSDQLSSAIDTASSAFNSGKSALDNYTAALGKMDAQTQRTGQIFEVLKEKLGTPLVGASATGMKGINDWMEGMIKAGDRGVQAAQDLTKGQMAFDVENNGKQYVVGMEGWLPFVREKTADEIAKGTAEGIEKGATDGAPKASDIVGGALSDAAIDALKGEMSGPMWEALKYAGKQTAEEQMAFINNNARVSYAPSEQLGLNVHTQTKIPIQFEETYGGEAHGQGVNYVLDVGGERFETGYGKLDRVTALKQLKAQANTKLKANVMEDFGTPEQQLLLGLIDQATYDIKKKVTVLTGSTFLDATSGIKNDIEAAGSTIGEAYAKGFTSASYSSITSAIQTLQGDRLLNPEGWTQDAQNKLNSLKDIKDELDRISQAEYLVTLNPNDATLRKALEDEKADLNDMVNKNWDVTLKANGNPAIAEIDRVLRELGKLKDTDIRIGAGGNIEIPKAGIGDINKYLQSLWSDAYPSLTNLIGKGLFPSNDQTLATQAQRDMYNAMTDFVATARAYHGTAPISPDTQFLLNYVNSAMQSNNYGAWQNFIARTAPAGTTTSYSSTSSGQYPTTASQPVTAQNAQTITLPKGYAVLNGQIYQVAGISGSPSLAGGSSFPVASPGLVAANANYNIPGLLPYNNIPDRNSFDYITNYKPFEDYPYRITPPTSFRWGGVGFGGNLPGASPIRVSGNVPQAMFSDANGMDFINNQLRQMQLDLYGKSQVIPWFARQPQQQPDWWTAAATKLSPGINWGGPKGDPAYYNMLQAAKQPSFAPNSKLKSATSAWNAIYDNSGTCIAFAEPDPSLKFTPAPQKETKLDTAAWNAVYDNSGTCIAYVEPDPSLKFTARNNLATANGGFSSMLPGGMIPGVGGKGPGLNIFGSAASGPLVPIWDPRNDSCIGFAAPDPSLKTSDPFYLGKTRGIEGSIASAGPEDAIGEYGGWANQIAQPLEGLNDQAKQQTDYLKTTADGVQIIAAQPPIMNMVMNAPQTALNIFGGGGGSVSGLAGWGTSGNRIGGQYGTAYGGWYTGGAAGLSTHLGSSTPGGSWGANAISGQGYAGAYAKGLIADRPTFGIFGEAGREALVPLDDKAAGMAILRQILPEFSPMKFASGGIIGKIMESAAPTSRPVPVALNFNNYAPIDSDVHLMETLESFWTQKINELANDKLES